MFCLRQGVSPHLLHPLLGLASGSPMAAACIRDQSMSTWRIGDKNPSRHSPSPKLWLLYEVGTQVAQHSKVPSLRQSPFQHPPKKEKALLANPHTSVLQSHLARWKPAQRSKWRHLHQNPLPLEASSICFSSTWKMNSLSVVKIIARQDFKPPSFPCNFLLLCLVGSCYTSNSDFSHCWMDIHILVFIPDTITKIFIIVCL